MKNHMPINILEEMQIMRAAILKYDINGKYEPLYWLLPSVDIIPTVNPANVENVNDI